MALARKIRQHRAVDKRRLLLDAALDLFEARGFDGVAVPEIARTAGVATGTVYVYFRDKEALVNALYRHWKTIYNDRVLAPLPPGLLIRDKFTTYWQRMMEFAQTHPRAVRFMDLHHHGAYLDEESRALSGRYGSVARDFIGEAKAAGVIRDLDPVMVVALMWGAATGLVKFASQGALKVDAQTSSDMEEALWRAIARD
ncbi:MAG TPA: TetR/AcrR family transcriptional regulator [Rhizomicrobium sp.]|nr:TetR/AcrR family transcriptional regulator [Rhizomicrobium sp.]